MSGHGRKSAPLEKGPGRKGARKRLKQDDPPRVLRTTAKEVAGVERFMPESFGPLPGYEHAHRYLIASSIFGKGRILDLASGSGAGTAALRAARSHGKAPRAGSRREVSDRARGGLQVVGLDLDLASARRSAPAVQGDAVRLPFANGSFDGVICFEVIEHLEEPPHLLEEIRRVLRVDGVALLSTPNRDVFTTRAGRSNPFHISEMNPEELLEVLGAAFPYIALYSQSVWAGSWLAEFGEAGVGAPKATRPRWRVASQDLAPSDDTAPAPWADRGDTQPPCPLYLLAICSSSLKAFDRARRVLGANHLLHDRAQWLLGHYMTSLGGLAERDKLIESHAMHGRNLQERIDDSRERVRSLETHVSNLEAERAPLFARIEALEEHATNLEAELPTRQHRIIELEAHAHNLENELEGQRAHATNLENELEGQRAHATNLAKELEAQRAHTTNLEAVLTDERDRISELLGRAESLGREVGIWREHADIARQELAEIRTSRTVRFVTWLRTQLRL